MLVLVDCFFSIQVESYTDSYIDDFLSYPGHFIYFVRRLWVLLKSFIFAGSHSLGLTCRSWPIFVNCGFNDSLIFGVFVVLFWFAGLSNSHLILQCCAGMERVSIGWTARCFPVGEGNVRHMSCLVLCLSVFPACKEYSALSGLGACGILSVSVLNCLCLGRSQKSQVYGDKEALQARLLSVMEFSLKVQHSWLGISWWGQNIQHFHRNKETFQVWLLIVLRSVLLVLLGHPSILS